MNETLRKKTWKREMAVAVFLFFATTFYTGVDNELIKAITWPTYTVLALSFGLDWWGKSGSGVQWPQSGESPNRGRPEYSGQHPVGTGEQPDSRVDSGDRNNPVSGRE
jgi:hypothetical protein